MNAADFMKIAIDAVVNYFNEHVEKTDSFRLTEDDVYIVWMCKTLQNNKALISTNIPDGIYYEFTWNGDKNEGYLDIYKKWDNVVVTQ